MSEFIKIANVSDLLSGQSMIVEVAGRIYCCAHCAKTMTSADVKDRVA